jgi:queuine tRNA-ribosyltransferase
MGVGTPWNILECIAMGIDMFDCVMPTRNGRNGMLFTAGGVINIKNKKWEKDFSPIYRDTPCFASRNYSKAYLRHLFVSKEILGLQLASLHNLCFYLHLVKQAREHILQGDFVEWKNRITGKMKERL